MIRDVVCGMTLDREDVVASSEFKGESYHFCSEQCRRQFDADAVRFAARSSQPDDTELERHEPPFTQGPLTAPKFGSAGSGGAEYERLPEMHDDEGKKKR
jgi:YHS domain-containing protein